MGKAAGMFLCVGGVGMGGYATEVLERGGVAY